MTIDRVDGELLKGVSATALWTLSNRAVEAQRPDGLIKDPQAVELYRRIDYDYSRFGPKTQPIALRALAFDRAVHQFAARHSDVTVVALGEGLQTSFWRVDNPQLRWVGVDLPPVIEVRRQLLPEAPQLSYIAQSALDLSWTDHIDSGRRVFISAEGLLMYLPPDQVIELIHACAQRFPGGQLIFDSIPGWFSSLTGRGLRLSRSYTVPRMPTGMSRSHAAALPDRIPGIASAENVMPPRGRGVLGNRLVCGATQLRLLRDLLPSITLLRFDE